MKLKSYKKLLKYLLTFSSTLAINATIADSALGAALSGNILPFANEHKTRRDSLNRQELLMSDQHRAAEINEGLRRQRRVSQMSEQPEAPGGEREDDDPDRASGIWRQRESQILSVPGTPTIYGGLREPHDLNLAGGMDIWGRRESELSSHPGAAAEERLSFDSERKGSMDSPLTLYRRGLERSAHQLEASGEELSLGRESNLRRGSFFGSNGRGSQVLGPQDASDGEDDELIAQETLNVESDLTLISLPTIDIPNINVKNAALTLKLGNNDIEIGSTYNWKAQNPNSTIVFESDATGDRSITFRAPFSFLDSKANEDNFGKLEFVNTAPSPNLLTISSNRPNKTRKLGYSSTNRLQELKISGTGDVTFSKNIQLFASSIIMNSQGTVTFERTLSNLGTDLIFTNRGTIVFAENATINLIDFAGSQGAIILAADKKIAGDIDNKSYIFAGILCFKGAGEITGSIGRTNTLYTIIFSAAEAINLSDASSPAKAQAFLYAADANVTASGGIDGNIFFNNTNGIFNLGAGKIITGFISGIDREHNILAPRVGTAGRLNFLGNGIVTGAVGITKPLTEINVGNNSKAMFDNIVRSNKITGDGAIFQFADHVTVGRGANRGLITNNNSTIDITTNNLTITGDITGNNTTIELADNTLALDDGTTTLTGMPTINVKANAGGSIGNIIVGNGINPTTLDITATDAIRINVTSSSANDVTTTATAYTIISKAQANSDIRGLVLNKIDVRDDGRNANLIWEANISAEGDIILIAKNNYALMAARATPAGTPALSALSWSEEFKNSQASLPNDQVRMVQATNALPQTAAISAATSQAESGALNNIGQTVSAQTGTEVLTNINNRLSTLAIPSSQVNDTVVSTIPARLPSPNANPAPAIKLDLIEQTGNTDINTEKPRQDKEKAGSSNNESLQLKKKSRKSENYGVASGDDSIAKHGIWLSPFYSQANQGFRNSIPGYKTKAQGGTIGFDTMLNEDLTIGTAFSMINTRIKHKSETIGTSSTAANTAKADSYIWSLYGMQNMANNFFIQGIASISYNKIRSSRQIFNETAYAKYSSRTYGGEVTMGRNTIIANNFVLTPMAGIRYSHFNEAGYKEEGSPSSNQIVKKKAIDKVEAILGIRTISSIQFNELIVIPGVHGFINQALTNKSPKIDARIDGAANSLPTRSAKTPSTFYTLGASLTTKYRMMDYGISYDATIAKKYLSHQGSLKIRANF